MTYRDESATHSNHPPALLTAKQVAAAMGVSPNTVSAWGRSQPRGWPAPVRTPGGQVRYRASDIAAYLEASTLRRSA